MESGDDLDDVNYIFAAKVASNLGSEWRDGIFGEVRLPKGEFDQIRANHLQSLIRPAIPFVNYLPGMNPGDLAEKQLYHLYVKETGLDKTGITGIRVGMIWEMYYLYSYIGVVLLGLFNAYLLSLFNNISKNDALNFARIMVAIASIFGVFIQYALFSIAAVIFLKFFAVCSRRVKY
jgi:hypothetical protein